ncbi:MAG: FAD-dependent oxidoreductase, partial [Actinomycetota bacterium]
RVVDRVEGIEPAAGRVALKQGGEVDYDRLLWATGARAKDLDFKGAELKGVFTFRTLADAEGILTLLNGSENAVVLGGGLVSVMAATALALRGIKVTMVITSRQLFSQLLDETSARMAEATLKEGGIDIIFGNDIKQASAAKGNKARVGQVVLNDGSEMAADIVVAGKGVVPNAEPLAAAGAEAGRGVAVDDHLATSLESVWAAGDVAESWDIPTHTRRLSAIWPNAVEQGRLAGKNMAGLDAPYQGSAAMNSFKAFELPFISAGLIKGLGEGHEVMELSLPEEKVYKKLVFDGDRLVGAIMVGDIDRAGIYTGLIKDETDVSSFREEFLRDGFGYISLPRALRKEKMSI